MSGVHTHMTNSLNTPAEALEYAYPLEFVNTAFAGTLAEKENTAARRNRA